MNMAETLIENRALSRCPRIRSPKSLRAAAEAIQRFSTDQARDYDDGADSGVVRVKIIVTKKQLRQMVAALDQAAGQYCIAAGPQAAAAARTSSTSNVELLLQVLRRRHMKRVERRGCGGGQGWRPALQSIPEDGV